MGLFVAPMLIIYGHHLKTNDHEGQRENKRMKEEKVKLT